MLFHITATHSVDDCPFYNPELRSAMQEADAQSDELARELGVTVHSIVASPPAHVFYSLLEADDLSAIHRFVAAVPMKQVFTVTPVVAVRPRS